MNKFGFAASGALLAALSLSGCGGNGSAAGVAPMSNIGGSHPLAQNYGHITPDTSIEHPGDAGNVMHTNHVISLVNGAKPMVTPSGFSPQTIRSAYGLASTGGSGTIVIVDAYNDIYALADFNAFAAQFGLPQETSTNVTASTNKVFQVVYAQGSKPRNNSGWSQEESLDIEWAHAMAPNAKIVLVEAANNSNNNLYGADDVAATIAGAQQCSNSWSGGESSGESSSDSHFNHAGVCYFFSSGDTGGSRGYPPASPNVVAVGGTSLFVDGSGHRTSETAWSGSGCGPSSYESRPSFQNVVSGIVGSSRGIADVSAVADPNTGVAVHWNGGWYVFGGTSVACPMTAGIVNLSGSNRGSGPAENAHIYAGLGGSGFYDVTSGSAGSFSAAAGYDFPTGVGSPNGTSGF